jgi:PH domain
MSAATTAGAKKNKVGEPHRIYWQQWIVSGNNNSGETTTTTTNTATTATTTTNPSPNALREQHSTPPYTEQQQQQQQLRFNRRELILSSAAIRLSRSAKVYDVTTLLRQTLQLPVVLPPPPPPLPASGAAAAVVSSSSLSSIETTSHHHSTVSIGSSADTHQDCLVLVGTLYSLPQDFVQYEHNLCHPQQQMIDQVVMTTTSPTALPVNHCMESPSGPSKHELYRSGGGGNGSGEPFHIVRTLTSTESPLVAYEAMELYVQRYMERYSNGSISHNEGSTTVDAKSLLPSTTTTILPKIQWYYVPTVSTVDMMGTTNATNTNTTSTSTGSASTSSTGTIIPNCVELDGYCTAMETDHDDYDSDSDNSNSTETTDADSTDTRDHSQLGNEDDHRRQRLCTTFPWLGTNCNNDRNEATVAAAAALPSFSQKIQRKIRQQDRCYRELCQSESQTPPHCCFNGYLLYRDHKDGNVWRRMFCILTNHELWYISRIYSRTDPSHPPYVQKYPYVRHGRIRLTRAILIQPTPNEPSLYRTPYAFEIISSKGKSHVFRASSKQQQTFWITSISERIILSYEASLFDNADLIMAEECSARNRRANALAVEPLWDAAVRVMREHQVLDNVSKGQPDDGTTARDQMNSTIMSPSIGNSIGSVVRWGMDVSIYKDRCRYVGSSMPTRTPVIVATPPRRRFFPTSVSSLLQSRNNEERNSSSSVVEPTLFEPLDDYIQDMIQITWQQATALLTRARSLAVTFQVRSSIKHDTEEQPDFEKVRMKLSHGVDTLCRHIDFVLTGRLDYSTDYSTSSAVVVPAAGNIPIPERNKDTTTIGLNNNNNSQRLPDGPPPADLFDHLLVELQSLAATADRRVVHSDKESMRSDSETTKR